MPSILEVGAYLIVNKLFPEKVESFDYNPLISLRGGGKLTKMLPKILEKILTDKAIKIGLLTLFDTATFNYFHAEIEALLIDNVFKHICIRHAEGNLKIVCNIIQEHELNLHTKAMKEIIVSSKLSDEHKIFLLKIKLDFIINSGCGVKARFLLMVILAALLAFTISGVGDLALILEALYHLFQEGKISKAIYKQVIKALAKRCIRSTVFIEHLLE